MTHDLGLSETSVTAGPGPYVALTSHKGGDRPPYVRDVAEAAMNDAVAERHRWEAMQRRLRSAS